MSTLLVSYFGAFVLYGNPIARSVGCSIYGSTGHNGSL
jgi:hypothetical protein